MLAVSLVEGSFLHLIPMGIPPNLPAPIRAEQPFLFSCLKGDRISALFAITIRLRTRLHGMSLAVGFHGIGRQIKRCCDATVAKPLALQ